jgi:uncharacterized protein
VDIEVAAASRLEPVEAEQRLVALDALRGFALLGIALMNVEFFTRPLQGVMLGLDPALQGADYAAGWVIMAFVQGKFWTLFSLLFGMGFALMLERADALRADPGFAGLYARRLLGLLLIGLAHAVLLWAGDILVPYALAGFLLLLLFRNTPVSRLWKWGLGLYLVPVGLVWLMALGMSAAQFDPAIAAQTAQDMERAAAELQRDYAAAEAVYRDGSYAAVTAQRWRDSLMQYGWMPMFVPAVLGMFLLGAWLLRSGRMRDVAAHRAFFLRLLAFGGPLGAALALYAMPLLLSAQMTVPTRELAIGMTAMTLASLLLCLAYASAIVLAVSGPWPGLARWLAPVGRLALSNYLLQSLVFTTLFYGYGFGLWGQVPRAWQVPLVLAVFALQVGLSRAWLARFRYGPVEWAWRAFTYGRAPRLRY